MLCLAIASLFSGFIMHFTNTAIVSVLVLTACGSTTIEEPLAIDVPTDYTSNLALINGEYVIDRGDHQIVLTNPTFPFTVPEVPIWNRGSGNNIAGYLGPVVTVLSGYDNGAHFGAVSNAVPSPAPTGTVDYEGYYVVHTAGTDRSHGDIVLRFDAANGSLAGEATTNSGGTFRLVSRYQNNRIEGTVTYDTLNAPFVGNFYPSTVDLNNSAAVAGVFHNDAMAGFIYGED